MNSVIVLAGGSSLRVGRDKALLVLADKPLIAHVTSTLAFFGDLIISISSDNDSEKYSSVIEPPHTFVVDKFPGKGAFGGLLSAVMESEGEYIAVAPCDTPFVTIELYNHFLANAVGYDGAVPKVNDFWEPLLAVYKKEPLLDILQTNLKLNKIRLGNICDSLNIRCVNLSEQKELKINDNWFFNINSIEDLVKAQKKMEL
jgi:molybdopterin-guanine dinucleotide biosynthesis protein A